MRTLQADPPRRDSPEEDRPRDGRDYRRRIDCAPRVDRRASPPADAGRGRGAPDPREWPRDRRTED